MAALKADELDLAIVFEWQDFSEGDVLMTDPTVWMTSLLHHVHEETPLPIALYANSGWCTDFAIRSLDQRDIAYRVAYSSDTSGGLKLAVVVGPCGGADLTQQHPGRLPRVDARPMALARSTLRAWCFTAIPRPRARRSTAWPRRCARHSAKPT